MWVGASRRGLGEAGATVYVTGRTVEEGTSAARLPGSVPTTAAEVTSVGGVGIAAPCDAGDDGQLAALIQRLPASHRGGAKVTARSTRVAARHHGELVDEVVHLVA